MTKQEAGVSGVQGSVWQGADGGQGIGRGAGSLDHTGADGMLDQAEDSWRSDEGGTQASVYRVPSWRIKRGGQLAI